MKTKFKYLRIVNERQTRFIFWNPRTMFKHFCMWSKWASIYKRKLISCYCVSQVTWMTYGSLLLLLFLTLRSFSNKQFISISKKQFIQHSHCWVTITTIHLQNFFHHPKLKLYHSTIILHFTLFFTIIIILMY